MASDSTNALVSADWLEAHITDPRVRILDCTWHHVSTNLDGRTQYRGRHLPGSVHFDIDHIADKTSSLPHMLPTAADFANKVGLLGIGNNDRVIVYDRLCGGAAAARAWWMFRVFGHLDVAMLDGGYGNWTRDKRATEMSPVRPEPRHFTATFDATLVRDLAAMRSNVERGGEQVLDARGPAKFDGSQDDVFPQKRRGHIPNAINVPWGDLVDATTGTVISVEALRARFIAAGVDLSRPIVTTCASGITACMLALGLHLIGRDDVAVYDGSWAEWNIRDDAPTEVAA